MIAPRTTLLWLSLLLFSGCAHLLYDDRQLLLSIDEQLAAQQYAAALNTLDGLGPKRAAGTQFVDKRRQTLTQLRRYERDVTEQGRALQRQQRWKEAHELYQMALTRVPESSPLLQEWQQFQRSEERELKQLRLKSDLIRARYLISKMELLAGNEAHIDTRSFDATPLAEYKAEAEGLAHSIHQAGREALQRKDYTTASRLLQLAANLKPDDAAITKSLATLTSKKEGLSEYVNELKKQAAGYYGAEKYEMALKLWKKALPLAPGDAELRDRISRVERVLKSLRALKKSQP